MSKRWRKKHSEPRPKPPTYLALRDVKWPITCSDTNEVCATYRDYLRSLHWFKFRASIRMNKSILQRCETCNTAERLELHHRTYSNLGNETAEDVTWLCAYCHDMHHNRQPSRRRFA